MPTIQEHLGRVTDNSIQFSIPSFLDTFTFNPDANSCIFVLESSNADGKCILLATMLSVPKLGLTSACCRTDLERSGKLAANAGVRRTLRAGKGKTMIPDYQACMLPLLKFASDQKIHTLPEAVEHIAVLFNSLWQKSPVKVWPGMNAISRVAVTY